MEAAKCRIKASERRTEAEDRAAEQKKLELKERTRYLLINEHNRLTFAVKEKEAKLRQLQESLRAKNLQPTKDNSEDRYQQRIRQLESNIEKMELMVTQARQNKVLYEDIQEFLQKEVSDVLERLDQRGLAVTIGQAQVEKVTKQLQSAAAATESIQNNMIQMEYETKERIRQMNSELCEQNAEEKELKRKMETLWCLCRMKGQESGEKQEQQQEEQEEEEEGEEVEEAQSTSARDDRCCDICGAPQLNVDLAEDMADLKEALGCVDVQDLVNKVVSQQAIKEQLLIEVNQYEEQIKQEAQTLADLESQYAELKFEAKPASTCFDKLKEEKHARLNQEVDRVQRVQAVLKQSQDVLDTIERGINNLYFRMSCVPTEDCPSASSTDSTDKLRVISTCLATLRERVSVQEPEIGGLDQEKVYSLLEKLNKMELRNNKRPTTPIDTPQLSEDEDESPPSREEIKRNSIKLIESKQSKKSSRKSKTEK